MLTYFSLRTFCWRTLCPTVT